MSESMWKCVKCETMNKDSHCMICQEPAVVKRVQHTIPPETIIPTNPESIHENSKQGCGKIIFWGLVLLLVTIIILLTLVGIHLRDTTVVVPNLIGLEENIAEEHIHAAGLRLHIVSRQYDELSEGLVFEQSIASGESVEPDTQINLTISLGPEASSPFDLEVWGTENSIQIEKAGVTLDVPIPPGVNTDGILSDQRDHVFIWEYTDSVHFMVEINLLEDVGINAEREIDIIFEFLSEAWYKATQRDFTEVEGSAFANIYLVDVDGFELVELIKIDEYRNHIIRIRLRMIGVESYEEFFIAYGFYKFYEMGVVSWRP